MLEEENSEFKKEKAKHLKVIEDLTRENIGLKKEREDQLKQNAKCKEDQEKLLKDESCTLKEENRYLKEKVSSSVNPWQIWH